MVRNPLDRLWSLALLPYEAVELRPHAAVALDLIACGLTQGASRTAFSGALPFNPRSRERALFLERVLTVRDRVARGAIHDPDHQATQAETLWAMAFALRRLDETLGRAPEPHELAAEGWSISTVIELGWEAAQLAEIIGRALEPAQPTAPPAPEQPRLAARHRHLSDEDIAGGHLRLGQVNDRVAA